MQEALTLNEVARFGEDDVFNALYPLKQDQLERLRKLAGVVIEDKYERGRGDPKYGNLPRHFSERQLVEFFEHIRSERLFLSFLVQFGLGLRVGELKGLSFLERQGLARVQNFKARRVEYIPVCESLRAPLKRYLSSDVHSVQKLRYHFRAVCEDAGEEFTYVYGYSKHKDNPRSLYQFTPHSLRHTAGNMVLRAANPLVEAAFLRHKLTSKFGVTGTYMRVSNEEMSLAVTDALDNVIKLLLNLRE